MRVYFTLDWSEHARRTDELRERARRKHKKIGSRSEKKIFEKFKLAECAQDRQANRGPALR